MPTRTLRILGVVGGNSSLGLGAPLTRTSSLLYVQMCWEDVMAQPDRLVLIQLTVRYTEQAFQF